MPLLPIPPAVDQALDALARRNGLPKDLATLIFSTSRHVIRAFAESPPDPAEIAKTHARLNRCLAILAQDPAADPDGAIAAELRHLGATLDAASVGPAPATVAPPRAAQTREAPRFIARDPDVAARPAAPRPGRQDVSFDRSFSFVARWFPASAAARAARDWYWFVLEELNGLGGLLGFQRQQGEAEAAARTERRVRATLDTLSWDAAAALRETWTFVEQRLRDDDDAWGPHLVLLALEPAADRVRDWRQGLAPAMRAAISGTPLGTQPEMERGTT